MRASLASACAFTAQEEGGLSLDPRDAGNYVSGRAGSGALIGSNSGISAATLASWIKPQVLTADMMRHLPAQTVDAIYQVRYWRAVAADQLPAGIDLMVADHAFNAGDAVSARLLQQCLGVKQDGCIEELTVTAINCVQATPLLDLVDADAVHAMQQALGLITDGVIGPQTRAAIDRHGPVMTLLVAALRTKQSDFYRALPDFRLYGADWLARADRRQMAAYRLIFDQTSAPATGA